MLDYFTNLPQWSLSLTILSAFVSYCIGLGFYRLFLSPLAKFPGDKLAALTYWYEFYYDFIKKGKYQFELERMHAKYGPVVRIGPEALHVSDPDFYEVVYAPSNRRRERWKWVCQIFGAPRSAIETVDHDHHRMRRSVISPSLSKRVVTSFEPLIQDTVETLCNRFREFQKSQKPLRARDAFSALTLDVITEYSFGFSFDSLNHPDFNSEGFKGADKIVENVPLMKHFPVIYKMINLLPESVVLKLFPELAPNMSLHNILRKEITRIRESGPDEWKRDSTIVHRILRSDLPPEEKELQRITDECQTLVGGGQVTTSDTLERAMFEILSHPEVLEKLQTELQSAMPDLNQLPPSKKLEQLPYLSAVIDETLRINPPVPGHIERIAPDEELQVQGFKIPPGTPVGMSAYYMHHHNPAFPEPHKFKPERWIVPQAERQRLERYLVPFSKGARMCVGLNLAYVELYLTLAMMFRRFNFEMYETTLKEIEYAHDFFVPQPYKGSERLRVIVKP